MKPVQLPQYTAYITTAHIHVHVYQWSLSRRQHFWIATLLCTCILLCGNFYLTESMAFLPSCERRRGGGKSYSAVQEKQCKTSTIRNIDCIFYNLMKDYTLYICLFLFKIVMDGRTECFALIKKNWCWVNPIFYYNYVTSELRGNSLCGFKI